MHQLFKTRMYLLPERVDRLFSYTMNFKQEEETIGRTLSFFLSVILSCSEELLILRKERSISNLQHCKTQGCIKHVLIKKS